MANFEVAKRLIEATRSAMERKEREYFLCFIVFWGCIVIAVAAPVVVAGAINFIVLSGADDNCWERENKVLDASCRPEAAVEVRVPAYQVMWGNEKAEIFIEPAPKQPNPKVDAFTEHKQYKAKISFWSALAVFWVGAFITIWAQARTYSRYWLQASYDRTSGTNRLIKRGANFHLVLITFVVTTAAAACYLPSPWTAVLAIVVPICQTFFLYLYRQQRPQSVTENAPGQAEPEDRPIQDDLAEAPLMILPATFGLGVLLGWFGFAALDEWVLPLVSLDAAAKPVFVTSVALLFTVAVVSGMLIVSLSRDFPSQKKAFAIAQSTFDEPFQTGKIAGDLWDHMASYVRSEIDGARVKKEGAALADLPRPDITLPEARFMFPSNPTFSTAEAEVFDTLIRKSALPLALVMAASLVVLGLGLDLLCFDTNAPDILVKARDGSEASFVLLLGLGMVTSFAIIVVPALIRLDYFVHVKEKGSDDTTAKETHISVHLDTVQRLLDGKLPRIGLSDIALMTGTSRDTAAKVEALRSKRETFIWKFECDNGLGLDKKVQIDPHPATDPLHEYILRRHLGAGKKKFIAFLNTGSYFAAFQDLLGRDWNQRIIALLTALAPVAFPAIFALLQ